MADEKETEFEETLETNHEEPDLETIESETTDSIKALKAKLKACDAEKRAHLEELQRTRADFLNSKKRIEEQALAQVARAENKHFVALLALADSFDQAMADQEAWESIDAAWRTGVEGIHQQLQTILKNAAVEKIEAVNETFDPNRHEAVSSTPSDGAPDTILEVIQTGYQRNGEVIRPAKVIISA